MRIFDTYFVRCECGLAFRKYNQEDGSIACPLCGPTTKLFKAPDGMYYGEFGSFGLSQKNVAYKCNGEYRAPRKGEHYLSGNPIVAWHAPNDLSTPFWIAIPGTVKTVTTISWEAL